MADITGLCWEINRYRGWKGAILNTYRAQAIETALRAAHDPGAIVGDVPTVVDRARKEAEEWRTDPVKPRPSTHALPSMAMTKKPSTRENVGSNRAALKNRAVPGFGPRAAQCHVEGDPSAP